MAADGHPIEILTADATKSEGWQRTYDYAMEKWGHVDALVNNLGDAIRKPIVPLPGATTTTTPLTDDEWRFVIDINLTEAFLGCRTFGPHFLERGKGRVVNISGFAARKGSPDMLAYSAAKAGVARLTQTLALEWAPYGVTVNCIAPGQFPDPEDRKSTRLNSSHVVISSAVFCSKKQNTPPPPPTSPPPPTGPRMTVAPSLDFPPPHAQPSAARGRRGHTGGQYRRNADHR